VVKEIGKVERIEDRWIELRIPVAEGCLVCHSKMSCSFHGPESAYGHIKIPFQPGIEVGDKVTFETQESAQNISALIIFGLPILLILAGYFVTTHYLRIPHAEVWGVIGGFVIYGLLLILFNKWFSKMPLFLPKVIEVEKSNNAELKSSSYRNP